MAICPHCFTNKPAFSSRCPQCTRSVGFIGGIVFDVVYRCTTLFFFIAIIFGIVAFFR